MRNNITILYPGLDNQALANTYPRTKAIVEYITADPEAMTQQWQKERKKGVGASAVNALMGCGYNGKSKLDLYNLHFGIIPPDAYNPAMEFGHDYEPIMVKHFCEMTNAVADEGSSVDFLVIDNEKPYLRVSPDRFIWEADIAPESRTLDNAVILECKTCSRAFPKGPDGICLNDSLPDEWYCQVQYQMGVCGISYCYLAWFNKLGREDDWSDVRGYFRIDFNEAFYGSIVAAIDDFWNNHIIPHCAPAPETGADVQFLYPVETRGELCVGTSRERDFLKKLLEVNGELDELKKQKQQIEDTLKVCIGDKEGMRGLDNRLWITFKATKESHKFDKDTFISENAELYQRYVHMAPGGRRFCIKIGYDDL